MTIEGKELAAGKYSLWTEPGAEHWTVIFNKQANVWHTRYPDRPGRAACAGHAADRQPHGNAGVLLPGRGRPESRAGAALGDGGRAASN